MGGMHMNFLIISMFIVGYFFVYMGGQNAKVNVNKVAKKKSVFNFHTNIGLLTYILILFLMYLGCEVTYII